MKEEERKEQESKGTRVQVPVTVPSPRLIYGHFFAAIRVMANNWQATPLYLFASPLYAFAQHFEA